ncbi:hypothetical protein GCM10025865_27650 [Paraoerskovia sediminicola]|uniref:D-inositol 3-phosphate glycosyltransferase n=1 Tax=Paraoerskovia sediminicola TaxID=1138587 RepID=A0ABM8G5R9_9CELL|nr:hypothetical protein GCM10025865_27650 [Paraoerskovia sediminicola]
MSAGTCVVASGLGAFRRVLDDGAAGALFAVDDPAALARTVVRLLDDPEERGRLAASGARFVHRFDWSAVTAEVLAVYETVVATSEASDGVDADPSLLARIGRRLRPGGGDAS